MWSCTGQYAAIKIRRFKTVPFHHAVSINNKLSLSSWAGIVVTYSWGYPAIDA